MLQRVLTLTVLVALAYAALGRLSMLLAIPPGFATAVFPPAGLALFCLIRFGSAALPGVWLGSVLMNLSTSWLNNGWPDAGTALMTAMIGVGAASQAGFGRWLLQHKLGLPLAWDDEQTLLRFALLAGAFSTLIGASMGIGSLWLAGQIGREEIAFNWLTWWVGDSIGVLLITPLLLLAASPAGSENRQHLRAVLLPMAMTFSLVTILFVRASAWEQQQIQERFLERAGRIERQLQRAFLQHTESLQQIERFFAASQDPSPADFADFTLPSVAKFNGHISLAWVQHIRDAERSAFESAMQRRLGPSFEIWHRDSAGQHERMPAQADYFPITYIEPASNAYLIGFDNGSGPLRRALMETALQRGDATVSPRIWLSQLDRSIAAVLLARPVQRRQPAEPSSLAVIGIQIASTIDYALHDAPSDGLAIHLQDLSESGERKDLFSNLPAGLKPDPVYHHFSEWDFAGRRWQVSVYALPAYLRNTHSWQAWIVMVAGMLFTGLIGAMLLLVHGRALRVQRLVEQRTAELGRQQQTMQTITDSAADAILLLDEHGCIQMANPAAAALLQQSSDMLRGQALARWLPEWQDNWLAEVDRLGPHGLRRDTQLRQHGASPREMTNGFARDGVREEVRDEVRESTRGVAGGAVREVELALTSLQRMDERRYCCLLHDMTDRIASERLKREFVATISHELRTPLTSIRGALALLRSGQVDHAAEQREQLVQIANDNSKRLLLLVNDLLDFEKLELGKLELELKATAVLPLLQQAIDEFRGFALSQSVSVQLRHELRR